MDTTITMSWRLGDKRLQFLKKNLQLERGNKHLSAGYVMIIHIQQIYSEIVLFFPIRNYTFWPEQKCICPRAVLLDSDCTPSSQPLPTNLILSFPSFASSLLPLSFLFHPPMSPGSGVWTETWTSGLFTGKISGSQHQISGFLGHTRRADRFPVRRPMRDITQGRMWVESSGVMNVCMSLCVLQFSEPVSKMTTGMRTVLITPSSERHKDVSLLDCITYFSFCSK